MPDASSAGDAFAVVAEDPAISISRGESIEVTGDLPWTALTEIRLAAGLPTKHNAFTHSMAGLWDFPEGRPPGLGYTATSMGLTLTFDTEPGLYVVDLWVLVDQQARPAGWGDANYGLLVEVTP